jgi:hypothetical protein
MFISGEGDCQILGGIFKCRLRKSQVYDTHLIWQEIMYDDSDDHPGSSGNSGTMIMDTTCPPSNIRYPQDVSLLNAASENTEKLLDIQDSVELASKKLNIVERAYSCYPQLVNAYNFAALF